MQLLSNRQRKHRSTLGPGPVDHGKEFTSISPAPSSTSLIWLQMMPIRTSKWAEVMIMPQTTAVRTIAALRYLFSVHGLPEEIVSDNGPQFVSSEFEEFTKKNGIRHTLSSPYHPASNGEAERFVRTFKEAMKAGKNDGLTLQHRLASFLLTYRTTPHSTTTTGTPPCELLMGRSFENQVGPA